MKRGAFALEDSGANKRARFWLGDQIAERIAIREDDDDDDGLVWNRHADGDMACSYDDDYDDSILDDESEPDDDDDDDNSSTRRDKSPVRGVTEDLVATMEMEI